MHLTAVDSSCVIVIQMRVIILVVRGAILWTMLGLCGCLAFQTSSSLSN